MNVLKKQLVKRNYHKETLKITIWHGQLLLSLSLLHSPD